LIPLYLDANVTRAVEDGLRQRGVDVLTAEEDGATRTPDPELLDRATALGRTLLTSDHDFAREATWRQAESIPFAGVLYAHQSRLTTSILEDIVLVALAYEPAAVAGQLIYLPLR
jgi:predicted nuclease of predicted toxin-antitoxin system